MPSADNTVQPETCDVSVNVCTYNRHQQLREALESIVRNESSAGVQYEVVVVDNNSTDPTPQVVQSFIDRGHRNVRYVFEGRQGLSYARNAAIAPAPEEIRKKRIRTGRPGCAATETAYRPCAMKLSTVSLLNSH